MDIKIILAALLIAVVVSSGCIGGTGTAQVKTSDEAQQTAADVGNSVGDVASKIEGVDSGLSGS